MSDKRFLHVEIDPLGEPIGGSHHVESMTEIKGTNTEQILMLAIMVDRVAKGMQTDYRELLLTMAAAGPFEPTSTTEVTIKAPPKKEDMP